MIEPKQGEIPDRLSVAEEVLVVAKHKVATGRVRVGIRTELIDEIARASLRSDDVDVTRVPIGREVDEAPSMRVEGDVTIIPVFEEILVVETRLLLKEELHIRRRQSSQDFEQSVELRKQSAVVERIDFDNETPTDQEA